jgi:hypothetical protein
LKQSAGRGVYGGGRRPFGWDVVADPAKHGKRFVPNATEQAALATMGDMRAKGATLREIAAAVGIKNAETVRRILDRAK